MAENQLAIMLAGGVPAQVAAWFGDLHSGGDDERFEFGLELLLRGLASYAEK